MKPGVWPASASMSITFASGLPRVWTSRIFARPLRSGRSTAIWRSKRPGRSSAGSRMSGRFVAAIMMMLSFASKPSISTSSWLSVCSRSSWPPPRPAPRWRPTASISSMKMMQGEFCLACSNRSRTREAPTPTNISTKSEPEIEKNGTPASPATARASSVLPVPGGPYSSTPVGMRAPSAWNFLGFSRNSLISCSSSTASSTPATSRKVIFGGVGREALGAGLAEGHHLRAAALDLVQQEDPDPEEDQEREHVGRAARGSRCSCWFDVVVDVGRFELFDQFRRGLVDVADFVLFLVLSSTSRSCPWS